MKRLTALAAFLLLLFLPAHAPHWLDVVPPVETEPLTVFHGSFGRHDTLATALQDHLSPAGVHRLVEAARPTYDLARRTPSGPRASAYGRPVMTRATGR